MADLDSYFLINVKNDGTYLELYPKKGEGKELPVDMLEEYLSDNVPGNYDKLAILEAVKNLDEKIVQMKIMDKKIPPINESVSVWIREDKMKAYGLFMPASNDGKKLSKEEIISELTRHGVKFGICEKNIDAYMNGRRYLRKIRLAEGVKPEEGRNAKITYNFNTDVTLKPRTLEDGSVDFHHLDNINKVVKDQLIAELEPAIQGKPGMDVCGGLLKPVKVSVATLKHGNNIYLSEDGLKMYSEVNGHVSLVEGRVFVSDTYEVPANVDTSTGDINYEGSVRVKGNVLTGFKIEAKGDIIVEGVVEGATLIAGGQIVLQRGIQGMGRGVLKAGTNVISKFIESATVEAEGYVSCEAIMHSKIVANGDITVTGKKGIIAGGELKSGSMISAKTIGSSMGTLTVLEVGAEPEKMELFRKCEKELAEIAIQRDEINKYMIMMAKRVKLGEKLTNDKIVTLKVNTKRLEAFNEKEAELNSTMDKIRVDIEMNNRGEVRVNGTIYQGTRIMIANVIYHVKKDMSLCKFTQSRGEIKVDNI